jgi:hypothetical protein
VPSLLVQDVPIVGWPTSPQCFSIDSPCFMSTVASREDGVYPCDCLILLAGFA